MPDRRNGDDLSLFFFHRMLRVWFRPAMRVAAAYTRIFYFIDSDKLILRPAAHDLSSYKRLAKTLMNRSWDRAHRLSTVVIATRIMHMDAVPAGYAGYGATAKGHPISIGGYRASSTRHCFRFTFLLKTIVAQPTWILFSKSCFSLELHANDRPYSK